MAEQMKQNNAGEIAVKQTIPVGYKQSEVGVIPKDWGVVELGTLCAIFGRIGFRGYTKADIVSSVQGVLSISPSNILNGKLDVSKGTYISRVKYEESPEIKIFENDVLLVKTGSTYGKVAIVKNLNQEATINPQVVVFKNLKCPSEYFSYLMQFDIVQRQIEETIVGGAIPTLSQKTVLSFKVPLSILSEQKSIGSMLFDADTLITGIEKLISKKQAIKTATRQQLLTGRTRLPQFSLLPDGTPKGYKTSELGQIPEDWEALAIDDCATKVGSGKTPNGGASVYIDAGRPFVRSQNIGWGRLMLDDVAYISDDIHNTFSGSEIKEDDVLLNITGASIGRCAITEGYIVGGNVNQHVCIIRLNSVLLNARLLVELINSRNGQKQIDSYQAGGNREGLNFQQVRQLKFAVSNSSVEQTAIATILSDMDSELTALEQKLAKARSLKQGMMQQLLTGRIRLPLPQEA